jgi:hypothetical protein
MKDEDEVRQDAVEHDDRFLRFGNSVHLAASRMAVSSSGFSGRLLS